MTFSFCACFHGMSSSTGYGVWPHCTRFAGCKPPCFPYVSEKVDSLVTLWQILPCSPASLPVVRSWCKPFCRAPIVLWIYGSYFPWHVVAGQTNQGFARMPKQFLLVLVSMRKGRFRWSSNCTSLRFAACAALPAWVFFMCCSESILCLISGCWVNHCLRQSPGPQVCEQASLLSSAPMLSSPICLSVFVPLVFWELFFSGPNLSTWPLLFFEDLSLQASGSLQRSCSKLLSRGMWAMYIPKVLSFEEQPPKLNSSPCMRR